MMRHAAVAAATPSEDGFWSGVWAWFLGVPLQILIIVAVTVVVIGLLRRLINRTVRRLGSAPLLRTPGLGRRTTSDDDAVGEAAAGPDTAGQASSVELTQRREQRANAIGSLLGSTVTVVAVGIALLTILPLLGIDIAPLLTSAGVLGVALGFGAQNLVKDYLSGIFIVLEDQYGVGDTVELSGVIGVIEEVTLRVTRLRDLTGVVWYVRNGEILTVGNRSQGWTLAIADIPVGPDTDLGTVKAAVERVAAQMMADPSLRDSLLAEPAYAGVESVSGEAMVVRVVARAAAEEQVAVGRRLREHLKDAFDADGIAIPVVLRMPGSAAGGPGSGATGAR